MEYPHRYTKSESGDKITLTPAPGTVTEEGSAINAEKLNNIEAGIKALETAHNDLDDAEAALEERMDDAEDAVEAAQDALDALDTQGIGKLRIGDTTYTVRTGTTGAAGYLTLVLED